MNVTLKLRPVVHADGKVVIDCWKHDQMIAVVRMYDVDDVQTDIGDQDLQRLPVMNKEHLTELVVAALNSASTKEDEIMLYVDTEFTI
tara:strand:- start:1120 stop:1383 length:264 start_codon:yes stop_codon:yes gene_type:complete